MARLLNHSRGRHGSTFDGAEWDGSRKGPVWCVQFWRCRLRLGRFNQGNRSCGRHSCVFDGAERDVFGRVVAWRCRVSRGTAMQGMAPTTTLSVSERAAASVAEWDESWCGGFSLSGAMWGRSRRRNAGYGNHHRAGTEADQRGRGGIFLAMYGQAGCGGAIPGAYRRVFNHTRAGTVPDRRGRCGMNRGWLSCGKFSCGLFVCFELSRVGASHGNHARLGTGSDQRRQRGMDSGMVRRVEFGSGKAWSGLYLEVICGR